MGGGSVIESAKGIALGAVYDGDVWDFFAEQDTGPHAVQVKRVPVDVVLTIAAMDSEISSSTCITEEENNLKQACNNNVNRPIIAIEDTLLMMSLPKL